MARELFDTEPVFAETVTRCAEAVDGMLPRPLLEVLFELTSDTDGSRKRWGTPLLLNRLCSPVEMGLARLWQSWGIEPDVVLGHSVGQYVSGVCGRRVQPRGRRTIDGRTRPAVRQFARGWPDGGGIRRRRASGATSPTNSRRSRSPPTTAQYGVVGSGRGSGTDCRHLSDEDIRCTWLDTSHAFHSELLEPALDEFESYAAEFEFAVPTLPLICNRTGAVLTAETPLDAQYWRRHSRQPVQFAESVRTVARWAVRC